MFFWARRFHLLLAGLKIGECRRLYDFFTVFVAFPLTCGRQIQGTDSFQSNALLLVPHVASLTATLRATIAGLGAKEAEAMKVCGRFTATAPGGPFLWASTVTYSARGFQASVKVSPVAIVEHPFTTAPDIVS